MQEIMIAFKKNTGKNPKTIRELTEFLALQESQFDNSEGSAQDINRKSLKSLEWIGK
ncbi:MAG TPA: hypothetical protein VIE65_02740 [Methylobacter sp.]